MNFICEYDICSLIVILTIIFSFFRKKSINTNLSKIFLGVLIFEAFSIIFELLSVYVILNPTLLPLWLMYLINIFHYVAMTGVGWSFTYCMFYIVQEKRNQKFKFKEIITGYFILETLMIVTSPFTRAIFYFDSNLVYHHGDYIFLFIIFSTLYILSDIYLVIKERKYLSNFQLFIVIIYSVFMIFVMYESAINWTRLLYNFICTASTLFIFFSFENPTSFRDKEMEMFNRTGFNLIAKEKLLNGEPYRIISFQILGLEYLTKTIGLENRNQLMKMISDLLYVACGKIPLYRLSRSKIAIIVPDDEETVQKYMKKIKYVFENPFRIEDFRIPLKIRMTNLACPRQSKSVDEAIDIIEKILKSMKKMETGTVLIADDKILEKTTREHKVKEVLKNAIQNDDLYVVYQPIYSTEKKRFVTAEALIRIKDTELGYIGPDEFIPIAEHNGLILQIGETVFRKVCQFIIKEKIWEKGIEYIHVNLSVIQCMQESLYSQLFEIMDEYGVEYKYINLEVTETSAAASSEVLKSNMNKMIEKNVFFALDDFGTGFSNMSTLIKYPFKTIKLDKSIIDTAFDDEKAKIILTNTIKMVKKLNMQIVAEGVESKTQLDELIKMGCNFIQGYYFSKPLKQNDFLELLK